MFTLLNIVPRIALLGMAVIVNAYAQSSAPVAVTDLAAPTPPLRYESAFSGYRAQQDAPPLPWKALFTPDGDFADTATAQAAQPEVTVRKPEGGHSAHAAQGGGRKVTLDTPVQLAQAAAPVTTTSDTHGRIEAINTAEGKVKLKHGPIPKFGMPGMTMVFRVQDPKLLKQIKVGDEVGVTMGKSGGGIIITGFQK